MGRKLMNITDHLHVRAEAAMRIALAGVSRPDGNKRRVGSSTVARCIAEDPQQPLHGRF
jgi:hypothetical protein